MAVLGVDAGTTGVTALVVGDDGRVVARGDARVTASFPRPGWVEQDLDQLWQATLSACRSALDAAGGIAPHAIGLTNQRESAAVWDRTRLSAPRLAISWQDRRTATACEALRESGVEQRVARLTGLRLDPYFTATKFGWLAEHDRATWDGVLAGHLAVGTVDSYLLARLTGGALHVTDASNASRTLLLDLTTASWSQELADLFGVPSRVLPRVVPSYGPIGRTDPAAFLGLDVPITGVAGDQQAALFGQACHAPGSAKCTYGTGSFVLANTADAIATDATAASGDRGSLLATIAWQHPGGQVCYALEGSVFVTGAAVQWLRDGLGLIDDLAEAEGLARSVPDSGGVVFVPALTGLGAPHWDPYARGTIVGLTRGTTRAHLVRATLEAIAFEVRDVVAAMTAAGVAMPSITVDGGGCANDLLCQLQADQLGVPVVRPVAHESTALGAAFLAGLGAGVWTSTDELLAARAVERRFEPDADRSSADAGYVRWRSAVARAKNWDAG